jgi:hypothetical protein
MLRYPTDHSRKKRRSLKPRRRLDPLLLDLLIDLSMLPLNGDLKGLECYARLTGRRYVRRFLGYTCLNASLLLTSTICLLTVPLPNRPYTG